MGVGEGEGGGGVCKGMCDVLHCVILTELAAAAAKIAQLIHASK